MAVGTIPSRRSVPAGILFYKHADRGLDFCKASVNPNLAKIVIFPLFNPHNRVFNARFSTGFRRFISPFHRRCPARPCALFQALSEACTRSSTGRQGRIVPLFLFIGGGQLKPKQRRFRSISISGFSSEPLRNGPISAVCERRKNRKSLIHRGASIFPSWR